MKHEKYIWGFILLAAAVLLLCFAPDLLSLGFVIGMVVLVVYGFIAGVLKVYRFCDSFRKARKSIKRACEVQTATPWNVLKEDEHVFNDELLDDEFKAYAVKVCNIDHALDEAICPIEDCINTEFIENNSSDTTISQIPGVLTSLGILGTFIGLLYGLNYIAITSVSTAIVTIESMLGGVRLAFYTSIAGVILSVLFNWCYHRVWHRLGQEIKQFYREFHQYVIPSTEEQNRRIELEYRRKMLAFAKRFTEQHTSNDKTED